MDLKSSMATTPSADLQCTRDTKKRNKKCKPCISKKIFDDEAILAGNQVYMGNGAYFHSSDSIVYLGSIIMTHMCNFRDIATIIRKYYGKMGALKEFFFSREIPLGIKLKLYLIIPFSTVLCV
jgi:hypothetical protein